MLCRAKGPIPLARPGGPGPAASLIVNSASNSAIYPGQAILTSWRLRNDCSDVGNVVARILLKDTGDLLYDSGASQGPIPAPPLGEAGEDVVFLRPPAGSAVAAALYRVGNKTLRLEVTGSGRNPGPYVAEAPLVISPEIVDPTWWNWGLTTSNPAWKDYYQVGGTLTNLTRGGSQLDVLSADFSELDAAAVPTGNAFAAPVPAGLLAAMARADFAWQGLIQVWPWLDEGTHEIIAPTTKTFLYRAELRLADEYGNGYVMRSQHSLVSAVTDRKLLWATLALALLLIFFGLVAAAIGALAIPVIGPAIAIGLAVLAAAAYFASLVALAIALDPPPPDFGYEIDEFSIPALPGEPLPAEYQPLTSLTGILQRLTAGLQSIEISRRKLMGARIDNHENGIRLQSRRYQESLRLLREANLHLPAAAIEVQSLFGSRLPAFDAAAVQRDLEELRSNGMPASFREVLQEGGISNADLDRMENAVKSWNGPSDELQLNRLLPKVVIMFSQALASVEAEAKVDLAGV